MNDKEKERNEIIRLKMPLDPIEVECERCGESLLPKYMQSFKDYRRVCDGCVETLKSENRD